MLRTKARFFVRAPDDAGVSIALDVGCESEARQRLLDVVAQTACHSLDGRHVSCVEMVLVDEHGNVVASAISLMLLSEPETRRLYFC